MNRLNCYHYDSLKDTIVYLESLVLVTTNQILNTENISSRCPAYVHMGG